MKFFNLNNKQRFYLLLAAMPLVVLICWKLALSTTFENLHKLNELKRDAAKYKNADQMLNDLQMESLRLKELEIIKAEDVDESLLELISSNIGKYNISLESFPEISLESSSNYIIQTYNLTFSGRYIPLLKFTSFLESELKTGKIISIKFIRTEERKTGEKLFMEIYYQLIFKNNP
jgi:hypothetical protein